MSLSWTSRSRLLAFISLCHRRVRLLSLGRRRAPSSVIDQICHHLFLSLQFASLRSPPPHCDPFSLTRSTHSRRNPSYNVIFFLEFQRAALSTRTWTALYDAHLFDLVSVLGPNLGLDARALIFFYSAQVDTPGHRHHPDAELPP
jgi:hypothetical protein